MTHIHKEDHANYIGHACQASYVSHGNDLRLLGQS